MVMSMNRSKDKGDRAEREAVVVLKSSAPDLALPEARRKLGAGRRDDVGDLDVFDDVTIQVKSLQSVSDALREAVQGAEVQSARARTRLHVGVVPIPRARRNSVRWLAITREWPAELPDDLPTFSITVRAVDWLRRVDPDSPPDERVLRLSRAGDVAYLGTISAWTTALRRARVGV